MVKAQSRLGETTSWPLPTVAAFTRMASPNKWPLFDNPVGGYQNHLDGGCSPWRRRRLGREGRIDSNFTSVEIRFSRNLSDGALKPECRPK